LDWQENLQSEELPPEWMWPYDDDLELWFEEVDRRRREKFGGSDADASSEGMLANEYARDRR
jgi:hypothetical protein